MLHFDPYEEFKSRERKRIQKVTEYRDRHPRATVEEIAEATGYLPSSIKLWLEINEVDDSKRRAERRKELRKKIYGS